MSKTALQLLDPEAVALLTREDGVRVCILQCGSLSNICQVQVDVRVGDDSEGMESSGQRECAHFLEHLVASMLRSRFYPDGEAKTWVEEHGIYSNAFTSAVRTSHFMNGHCSKLKHMIDIQVGAIADFLEHGPHKFFEELSGSNRYKLEKLAVVRELSGKVDSPEYKMYEAVNAVVFDGHPRSVPQKFDAKNVLDLNADTVRAFFEKHYVARNIMITVAGPSAVCQTGGVMAALEGYKFSQAAPTPAPALKPFEEGAGPGEVLSKFVKLPESETVRVTMAWPLRLAMYEDTEPGRRRVQAVSALTNLLTGGFTSRFLKSLRTEEGLVYGISAGKSLDERDKNFGTYQIETSVDKGKVGELAKGVFHELARMMNEGPTKEEMEKYRTRIYTAIARRVSDRSPGSWVDDYSNQALFASDAGFATGSGIVSNERHFELAKTVTAQEIQAAASEVIKFFEDPVVVVIGAAQPIDGLADIVQNARKEALGAPMNSVAKASRKAQQTEKVEEAKKTVLEWLRNKKKTLMDQSKFTFRKGDKFNLPVNFFNDGSRNVTVAASVLRQEGGPRMENALDALGKANDEYNKVRQKAYDDYKKCPNNETRYICAINAKDTIEEKSDEWFAVLSAVEAAILRM